MTIAEFEKRIQRCNPKLHVKRYGTSKAAIHFGNVFICRVPQGEITPYNVFRNVWGTASQYRTEVNPSGLYMYRKLIARGRMETARILYTQRWIKFSDIAKITAL